MWVPGTNWYEIKRLRETAFQPSEEDNIVSVHIIWGLREQDRSTCHFTDYKCKGKTVLDSSFDLNPPPCQNAMLVSSISMVTHLSPVVGTMPYVPYIPVPGCSQFFGYVLWKIFAEALQLGTYLFLCLNL